MNLEQLKEIDEGTRNIYNTLSHMKGNNALVIWCLVGLFPMAFAIECFINGFLEKDKLGFILGAIIVILYVLGIILIRAIRLKKKYIIDLLDNSSKLGVVTNERQFLNSLETSLKKDLVHKKKRFVITKDFFISGGINEYEFSPVAIPRDRIKDIRIRQEFSKSIKTIHSITLLEITLDNNEDINCCVASRIEDGMELFKDTLFEDVKKYKERNEINLQSITETDIKATTIPLPFDFSKYSFSIVMKNTNVESVMKLATDYNDIYEDDFQFGIDSIKDHEEWIVFRVLDMDRNDFWTYSNLIIWMSQCTKNIFGFAWNKEQSIWSEPYTKDPLGESVICLYDKSTYKYNVPENYMKRLLIIKDAVTPEIYIKNKYGFDTNWIR